MKNLCNDNFGQTLLDSGNGYQGLYSGKGPTLQMHRFSVHSVLPKYFAIDSSGSMSGPKGDQANAGFQDFTRILSAEENRDGVLITAVAFNHAPWEVARFKPAHELMGSCPVNPSGGTNLGLALEMIHQIHSQFQPGHLQQALAPVCTVLSDGCTHDDERTRTVAQAMKAAGFTIVSVGYGSDADEQLLTEIATSPQHYKKLMTGPELRQFFNNIGNTVRHTLRSGTSPAAALAAI